MLSFLVIENYSDVIIGLIIGVCFIILAKLANFILAKFVIKLTKNTKTTLDDKILEAIKTPIFFIIVLVGIYFALIQLNILSKYLAIIEKTYAALYILIAAILITRIINAIIKWYAEEFAIKTETKLDTEFLPIIRKVIIGFIYASAIIILLKEIFNVEIGPLLAGLGIAGLAVALALQQTLTDFFAGVQIVADRAIKIGNYVELENGIKGYIEDIGWRTTKIKKIDNNMVVIPNSKLAQSIVTNYYAPEKEMSIAIPCGVSYDSDLEKVEKVTIEVAKEIQQNVPGAIKNFEPFIRYNNFGDSNIEFSVILRVNTFVDRYLVTHEFIKKLKKRYDEEGIEISFPVRNVYFKK